MDNLCLIGGYSVLNSKDINRKDGIIFNHKTCEVKKIDADNSGLIVDAGGIGGFTSISQSIMQEPGKIISLVKTDGENAVKLICFKEADYNHTVTIIHHWNEADFK